MVRYDQQGCYSPHVFFVERGGKISPRDFCRYVAHELANFEKKYPRRALTIAEAGDVAAWRHQEEAKALAGNDSEVIGGPDGAWSGAYVEGQEEFSPSGLNRAITLVAVDSLQTGGIAAPPEELYRLADRLGQGGVTRISALGQMTAPEAGWHHDGRFNLLDLVTLSEIEHTAEAAADGLAPYVD